MKTIIVILSALLLTGCATYCQKDTCIKIKLNKLKIERRF